MCGMVVCGCGMAGVGVYHCADVGGCLWVCICVHVHCNVYVGGDVHGCMYAGNGQVYGCMCVWKWAWIRGVYVGESMGAYMCVVLCKCVRWC